MYKCTGFKCNLRHLSKFYSALSTRAWEQRRDSAGECAAHTYKQYIHFLDSTKYVYNGTQSKDAPHIKKIAIAYRMHKDLNASYPRPVSPISLSLSLALSLLLALFAEDT